MHTSLRLVSTTVLLATYVLTGVMALADVSVPYTVDKDGRVSLAIYDSEGRMVRTLLTGAPRKAGKYVETWDGLDRYGYSLPEGKYTWKLLATEGLRAEFITQVGQNVDPAWERATGNHEAPVGVAVDATGLYRVGATNEGAHWGVKTDLEGRHLWVNDRWSADPWAQGTVAVTLVDGHLFELMPNGHLYGYNASTGHVFTGADYDPKPWDLCWEAETLGKAEGDKARKQRAARCPRDMAGDRTDDLIVAAYPQYDTIAWFSAKDGSLVDKTEGLSGLAGVAVDNDGVVFAISQGRVVALTRANKKPRVAIPAEKLHCPWRLCVSPAGGDVFVAENSDLARGVVRQPERDFDSGVAQDLGSGVRVQPTTGPHHQVKRFSAKGELLQTYGRPEGRADGVYVPTDFRHLTDIEADHEGGYVVTEGHHTPPRRSARFAVDGKLLREWFGAQHYGVIVCPEPNDPCHVWARANAGRPGLVRYEVDYKNRTWRVAETYQLQFDANRYYEVPVVPYLFERDGHVYLHAGGVQPQGLSLAVYDRAAKRIRPCNASGSRERDGRKRTYLWNDLNDDGLASDDEIQWIDGPVIGGALNPVDFTILTTPHPTGYNPGRGLKPSRFTAGGTPVYLADDVQRFAAWQENGQEIYPLDFRQGEDGSWYGCFAWSARNPNEDVENHGAWYYNSCSAIDRLVKWDKDWNPLWSVGRHSPDNDHEIGSTAMPRGLVGLAHGCVVWGDASDEETCRPTVWTEDGLYVDELLRVPVDQVPKDAYGMFNANEYPLGHLSTDPRSGETFFYALNSGGGSPIYRIRGWDDRQRTSGTVSLTSPASQVAKRDGTGITGEYFNNADCSGDPALTRIDPLVYFNWGKGAPSAEITAETFSVRWRGTYEAATNEDTRFEIRGSFPWRDKGHPLWARLWLGGQLVFDSQARIGNFDTVFGGEGPGCGNVRVKLLAGQRIDLRLECGFARGKAAVALSHDTPGLDRRAVLTAFLHPEPGPECKLEIVGDKRAGLIADFGFEEPGGALCQSRAGAEVFGRLTGNARRVPGKVGMGVELEGRSEFDPALLPIDEELHLPDTDYTVAFWFRTTSPDVRLCEARRYSSYNNRWSDHVVSLNAGKVQFQLQGDEPLETTNTLHDGHWHHVATTVGKGGQRLYVDSRLVATGKLERRTKTSNRLGLDLGPGGGPGVVTIDEVKVSPASWGDSPGNALGVNP